MLVSYRCLIGFAIGITAALAGAPAVTAARDSDPASLVETYEYPNADLYPDIKLVRGDGHILIVDCNAGRTSFEVWSFIRREPFCFELRGEKGSLSLELANVYGVQNLENQVVSAKVTVDGATKTVAVPAVDWKGIGAGDGAGQAVLLELRV